MILGKLQFRITTEVTTAIYVIVLKTFVVSYSNVALQIIQSSIP